MVLIRTTYIMIKAINILMTNNKERTVTNSIHWLTKLLTSIGIFLFFEFGYIWASKGHQPSDIINGAFAIDHSIPLIPEFIIPYMLGYFFVLTPIFLFSNKHDYYRGVAVFILTLAVAFILFKLFPIQMSKTYATGSDAFSQLTYFQQKNDTSFNNCPSLHVTLNLYCWGLLFIQYGRKMLWLSWAPIAIIASTLFVKQHLAIDVIGGTILGLASSYLFYRLKNHPRLSQYSYQASMLVVVLVILMNLEKLSLVAKILTGFLQSGGTIIAFISGLFITVMMVVLTIKNRNLKRTNNHA